VVFVLRGDLRRLGRWGKWGGFLGAVKIAKEMEANEATRSSLLAVRNVCAWKHIRRAYPLTRCARRCRHCRRRCRQVCGLREAAQNGRARMLCSSGNVGPARRKFYTCRSFTLKSYKVYILANQRRGKRANGYFGCTESGKKFVKFFHDVKRTYVLDLFHPSRRVVVFVNRGVFA
jgi:hypothetical protein